MQQLLGQAKDNEIQARLNRLREKIDKNYDNNHNANLMIAMLMMMMMMIIIIMVEMNYIKDTIILEDQQLYQIIMMKKNYFVDSMTLEHLCFEIYHPHHLCH